MPRIIKFILLLSIWLYPTHSHAQNIEQSVVKIINQYNRFSWYTPWDSGATGKGTGSGFVIDKKRILTNAHVVSDSALLVVYFHNDPNPYIAEVIEIGHDCDLALLEIKDHKRIDRVPPLSFDGLPALRSSVVTYGYPAGGQLISSTAGVVSRIEMQSYIHSGVDMHLAVQTDAAINPGNSGGPVIQNGKVVGVAFQGNATLENMGFFIPAHVIEHFLTDIEDGTYHGFPESGILTANLENPAAQNYSGLKATESGVRIDFIAKKTSAEKVLKVDDIITSIDGYNVANDGTIKWNNLRLDFKFLFDLKQMGKTMSLNIIRGEKRRAIDLPLGFYNPTPFMGNLYDRKPSYYIYDGLVFVPLNRETIKTYSSSWQTDAPGELIYQMFFRPIIEHVPFDTPSIIQIRRLDHATNIEEGNNLYHIVDTVNGKAVQTLSELAQALETGTNSHQIIRFKYDNDITILDRKDAASANDEILKKYTVPKDRLL